MKEVKFDWFGAPKLRYEFLKSKTQKEVIKRRALDLATAAHGKSMIVFLDKTARPLYQLLRSSFSLVYPGEVLPRIRFVNIGSEKNNKIRSYIHEVQRGKYFGKLTDNLVEIKDKDDFVKIFGQENIDYLVDVFKPSKAGERRLIVDDLIDSGATRAISMMILSIIDPQSLYYYFPFLESDRDRRSFCDFGGTAPSFPWHSTFTLVHDQTINNMLDENSFKVQRERDFWKVEKSRVVRHELRQLCDELKSEYHHVD